MVILEKILALRLLIMRIISGKFRGKKLNLPNKDFTRPLKDLVKESVFNLIQHSKKINLDIKNSLILDLFSGSGSFGIDCISRGANEVLFFENNIETLKILEKNLFSLKSMNNFKIYRKDCFDFFKKEQQFNIKFDLIFIDPPFKEERVNEIIHNILTKSLLKLNGIIILHRHRKDKLGLTDKFNIIEERNYGISKILIGN